MGMQRLSLCLDIDGTITDLQMESEIRRGVREVISELYQTHYIHFVSARQETMEKESINWLYRNRIPFDSMSLLGSPDKISRLRELEGDIVIEDCYDHAIQLARAGFDVLLIDCCYNQGPILPNITRVFNWYHVKAAILRRLVKEAS